VVVLAAGLALGVTSLVVARDTPDASLAGASTAASVAFVAIGWALVACGVVAWARRAPDRPRSPRGRA